MSLKLLLVEDDADYAEVLTGELRSFGHAVRSVADGRAALQAIERDSFDAVVLDRMLPRLDGVSVLHRLREAEQRLPVVMLTALGRSAEKVEGLQAGADDYVVKPVAVEELNARLYAILRGRQWTGASADTVAAGDIVISPTIFRAWQGGEPLELSRLQFRMLTEFVRNADTVLTRAMLIERVWGYDFEPTGNVVDAQVCILRAKLAMPGRPDRIATVRGVGYVLRG